ncbi:unknown protein [Microcystis aeruginosa NIES-843]|uniref:Uncharacterized protein n=1 Tax=Microcystis aeruginosa (strain NIES-843 / IAM M-2473) TaxID=449447 RepID=B0JRZ0_MICAN|nr:unknown protein [Microcystis aeruginosa NIES-843]
MTPSKSVKPHTPHPTPYTLPLGKTFSADPKYCLKPFFCASFLKQLSNRRHHRSKHGGIAAGVVSFIADLST